jgi:ribosomal protein L23
MTRDDVKQYLEKIYKLDVRSVRITNKPGEVVRAGTTGQFPLRREKDPKFAVVAIKGEESFEMPKLDFFLDKEADTKDAAEGGEKPEKDEKSSLGNQYKQMQTAAKEDRKKNWLKQDLPSWFQ